MSYKIGKELFDSLVKDAEAISDFSKSYWDANKKQYVQETPMKLKIRETKQEEEVCEVWLELDDDGDILVKSSKNGHIATEVALFSRGMIKSTSSYGNFEVSK